MMSIAALTFSNRESERQIHDCLVTIAGSLANKQDAACLIIQQLETFRLSSLTLPFNNPSIKMQETLYKTSGISNENDIDLRKREHFSSKNKDENRSKEQKVVRRDSYNNNKNEFADNGHQQENKQERDRHGKKLDRESPDKSER